MTSAHPSRKLTAVLCVALMASGDAMLLAQETPKTPPAATPAKDAPPAKDAAASAKDATQPAEKKLPPDQLDSLVAPIALYPDDLLAQTLAASTYPLEVVQLEQWMEKNKNLKDKALADAVAKQPWDPVVQSLAAVPEVVKRLADDIQWATDLGNAFLAQQQDVMDAVQRMRTKAKNNGALETNQQQKVETKVVEQKTVIVVESANPEVVYVPSYSPTVVYGAPVYPYPPVYYPPYPPGAAFVSFGIGVMWGAAIWGGSCCGCGWGHSSNVNINVNNNFNRVNHYNGGNRGGAGGGNWSHNPQHRGGAPYGDRNTASKYGGSSRGDGGRPSAGQQPSRGGGAGNRGGSPSAGTMDRGGAGNRGGSPSAGTRPSTGGGGGGADRMGSRNMPSSGSSRAAGGFGGGGGGYSGSSARASSSRGMSSMGGGGGRPRGGGGGGRRR